MKKTKKFTEEFFGKDGKKSELMMLIVAVLGILMGLFFILYQNRNTPIPRSDAASYSGEFEEYVVEEKSCTIKFKDGSSVSVFPYTETKAFRNAMKSLEKGTTLYILINPNNDYAVEIKTDTQELLNFEKSQEDIASYDNGYVAIGVTVCVCGVGLIVISLLSLKSKRKEKDRHSKKARMRIEGQGDSAIRRVDQNAKKRILLEATVKEYRICYRRVKHVNELVVNDLVYDEIKGILEFEHTLSAVVDDHTIEAGQDANGYSYIAFDGKRVAKKKRMF